MKNKLLKRICVIGVISISGAALAGAAWDKETAAVKDLLQQRTDVIENTLWGNITYEEGKEQLMEIEEDMLLKRDLEAMQAYKETDIDKVERMDIVSIERKSRIYDIMTFEGTICWTCHDMDGVYTDTTDYQIGVKKNQEGYRLISMEIQ